MPRPWNKWLLTCLMCYQMFKCFWYSRFSQKQAAVRDWDVFLQTFLSIASPPIPFYPSSLRCVNFVFLPYPLVTVRCMQMSRCLLQQTPTHPSSSPSQTQCNYCTANLLTRSKEHSSIVFCFCSCHLLLSMLYFTCETQVLLIMFPYLMDVPLWFCD